MRKNGDNLPRIHIIDCRFPYEYDGGHFSGALNMPLKDLVSDYFFNNVQNVRDKQQDMFIFHCEFSQSRGPGLYQAVRETDRVVNENRWPKLFYPEIYMLKGGFAEFH